MQGQPLYTKGVSAASNDSYDGGPQKVTTRAKIPKTDNSYRSYKNVLIWGYMLLTIRDGIMDICPL